MAKKFRIERLEERIAPSAVCCVRGGSSGHKGGSKGGSKHKGGSKGGSKCKPSKCPPAPKHGPCH